MRRYKKKVMVISLVCLLVLGNLIYKEFIRVQNIFDQMHYTRIRTHYDWWGGALGGFGNKADSFSKMPQTEPISRDEESFYTEMGVFDDSYKEEYLRQGESLVIVCDRTEKTVEIIAVMRFNEFDIIYRYRYDIKTKKLHENLECEYGERSSGESNEYLEGYKEYSEDLQEILVIIEKSGLTKEDLIEYKKYFLYDKLLTDWLAANYSRFSIENLGNVEFIEVLPLEDGD